MLSQQTGLSFVCEASLDDKPVTIEAHGLDIEEVMGMISRRIGVEVHRAGRIFYVGAFRPEDRALLVRRVRRLEKDQIQEAVGVLLSSDGRLAVYDDGLVVIGDKLQVLGRIDQLLEQVEASEAAVWAVQFWLVSLTDSALTDLGFDISPSLDVAVAFAQGSAVGGSSTALQGGLSAVLDAAQEENQAELMVEHLALIRDGVPHTFFEGSEWPVRVERVSNEGTSTTTDISYIPTGLTVEGLLREYSPDSAKLAVMVDLSELVGVVDGFAPQTSVTRFETEAIIKSDGVYLLRSHRTGSKNRSRSWLLSPGRREEDRARTFQLWCRARRVGGPATLSAGDVRSKDETATDDEPPS
ncbi:type II and III secretion system protein [Botrimarina mediterranea]|uniref:type II and III secretion system protein n=1 Tax=Botrimarina mediterranea TaxID=2528022 RepID=UPI00118D5736|nr:hypothetical protein K2D_12960 [Planctomycetes bacterium K2D]